VAAFVSRPASDKLSRKNFALFITRGVKLEQLTTHASSEDLAILRTFGEPLKVWGFRRGRRNDDTWNRLQPGHVALFYEKRAYRRYAPVLHKWIDHSDTALHVHEGKGYESVPLKFVVGKVSECFLSVNDYNDLLGYRPKYLPADPRVVDGDGAAAILSAITGCAIDDDEFSLIFNEEGQRKYRRHLAIERSPSNRKKVLDERGYICEACGFDFLSVYGTLIGKYAEVHHLRPLSLGKLSKPSLSDFAVLCASCHRAIHRPSPADPLSLARLKTFINKR
jgi:predicted restriction endonuclease